MSNPIKLKIKIKENRLVKKKKKRLMKIKVGCFKEKQNGQNLS
jgi:hypothetical protein